MNEEMFKELIASIREGGAIRRGERKPSRMYHVKTPDVRKIRETLDLSQSEFASLLGISTRTLQNWEQKRREPVGPARILLEVAAAHPEVVLETVHHLQPVP